MSSGYSTIACSRWCASSAFSGSSAARACAASERRAQIDPGFLGGAELRELALRGPRAGLGAEAGAEPRVREAFEIDEHAREGRANRLEVFVAARLGIRALELAQGRQPFGRTLEDGRLPQDDAGAVASLAIEIAEGLVELPLLDGIARGLGAGKQLLGDTRGLGRSRGGALGRDPSQRPAVARCAVRETCGAGAVAGTLVLEGRLQLEQRPGTVAGVLGGGFTPRAALAAFAARAQALVKLPQTDVARVGMDGRFEQRLRFPRLAVRDEQRLAHEIERFLDVVARHLATRLEPLDELAGVGRRACLLLADPEGDRECRLERHRALQPFVGTRRIERARLERCLEQE